MFDLAAWFWGLGVILAIATVTWMISLPMRNAAIADSVWSWLFVAAAFTYAAMSDAPGGSRRTMVLIIVTVWSVRLSGHVTWRNRGHGEDRRYQALRRHQGPRFPLKSLATVFWLQGGLAWVVSIPLLGGVDGGSDLTLLDGAGLAVWVVGFGFEAIGDLQLARFKADQANAGIVMDRGLWQYTRHPNYFGDFVQWWGFFLIALATGAWWSVAGPAVMSWLLLRYSGVTLLERGLQRSKPGYAAYVARTNAFFPGPIRSD